MGHSLFNGKELYKGFLFHVEIQVMPSQALVFNFKEGRKIFKQDVLFLSYTMWPKKKKSHSRSKLEDMCLLPVCVLLPHMNSI